MGPLEEWMLPTIFMRLKALESAAEYKGLCDTLQEDAEDWKNWFMQGKAEEVKMPSGFEKQWNEFYKLAFIRAIRPDRLPSALTKWLGKTLGENYVVQPPFDMAATFKESSNQT